MLLTGGLLGLLYVAFAAVLISYLQVGFLPMLLIIGGIALFQYFTSDKLALLASGAKVVTPEQAPALAAAFRAGGNRDVTLKIFPSTNHLFLIDPVGNPSGYASLPSKSVRVDVLGTIADWLAVHLK
jgi:hypothetical protein